jgi:hypothetical protein
MTETQVSVTFELAEEYEDIEDNFPITVQVGELLFEDAGGNLTEMTDEDKREMDQFIREEVTAADAIDEALSVISCAPAFDHIHVSEVNAPGVVASVSFTGFTR